MRKQKYQYEALLRDAHEYVAVWAYVFAAGFLFVASELALLIPSVAWGGALFFVYRGYVRYGEGRYVKRYQANIKKLPLYILQSKKLPKSMKQQFLGVGFLWTAVHAQRIYDIELPKNARFVKQSKRYEWARRFVYEHENSQLAKPLVKFLDSNSRLNPWPPLPDLEGKPYLHAVGMPEGERDILQPLSTRVAHTLVLGTTRVGKTRLAELLITQDIHRGDVVICFDPKGDKDLLLRMYVEAKKAGREDQFYMFHLGFPEQSAQYNPVGSFMRVTEVATRIANQMPGEGQSLAFREFVWGFVNQIAKGLVLLGRTPSYPAIKTYSQNIEPLFIDVMERVFTEHLPNFKSAIAEYEAILKLDAKTRREAGYDINLPRAMAERSNLGKAYYLLFKEKESEMNLGHTERDVASSLMKGFQTDASYMAKLVASLDPFLQKLTTGAVSQLISPDFEDLSKDVFSWSQIIQSGGVVYVGLDALSDAEVAATVGNSMFADLTSVAGRLYKHGTDHGLPTYAHKGYRAKICIHADEFNELSGPEFIPMLNKAGGAGIQVTAYTQTLSDIEARMGNRAKAEQMLGNFNSLVMMRVLNESTARILTEKQIQVNVSHGSIMTGTTDNSDIESDQHFTSATRTIEQSRTVDLLRVSDLAQLPKGQAFALIDGNNLYKLRIPWLKFDRGSGESIPESIDVVASQMQARYQSASNQLYNYQEYLNVPEVVNENLNKDGYKELVQSMQYIGDIDDL